MNILTTCPQISENTASRIIDDEAVVVTPQEGLVRMFNDVGSRVWQMTDGQHSINEISEAISQEFDVPPDEAQRDVVEFLEKLQEKGMVTL
jgi:hypothetical protein